MVSPVIREGAAVPAMPAVPVVPGHDEQPMELADDERARAFANPNRPDEETVELHNLTHRCSRAREHRVLRHSVLPGHGLPSEM